MKITLIEPTAPENRRSVGSWFVERAVRSAGYDVRYVTTPEPSDVELVSLHHQSDYFNLAQMPRLAKIRIIGGHPMASNPEPVRHLGDVVCCGEGESWITEALNHISRTRSVDGLRAAGTLLPEMSDCTVRAETVVPEHPPFLNIASSAGHDDTWYIELSRGCASKCHYCDLGWSGYARHRAKDSVVRALDNIDRARTNKVSLFAPDEADHPDYPFIIDEIRRRKLVTQFGSLRVDSLRASGLSVPRSFLMRFGIDGLTEESRRRVGKPISNDEIYEMFRYAADIEHTNIKLFMIIGYPWEVPADFEEFDDLMQRCAAIPRRQNAHVRIKWTPLIPQPNTPLGAAEVQYPAWMAGVVSAWHARNRHPARSPGLYIVQDGKVMNRVNHAAQCALAQGGEDVRPYLTRPIGEIADAWLRGRIRKAARCTTVLRPNGTPINIERIQRRHAT